MPTKKVKEKTEELSKRLTLKNELVWDKLGVKERKEVFSFAENYKEFLDRAKTEREAVNEIINFARKNDFRDINDSLEGNKFFKVNRNKGIALAVLGEKPLTEGVRIVCSHLDSPRLDLKQNPLYEKTDLAFLKTHYYGGIKKYHWVSRPLALHGKIVKKDGTELDLKIGENPDDPVFTITDLLPHLAKKVQFEKKFSEAIIGENLNLLSGSIPFPDQEAKERMKLQILEFLNNKYGLIEEDFVSAEIEIVPAEKARDIGWDRSLIGAYGQDDRVCTYASLEAIVNMNSPKTTVISLFVDKEEIGSDGNTGAKSRFLEVFIDELIDAGGMKKKVGDVRKILWNAKAISADVNGALDPDYESVHEKRNAARLGFGLCITKFTGSGGKYSSSDASAEYLGWIRNMFNKNKVIWQTGELGKVDEGGGGTIAKYLASYGMEIVDCGTSLLGMHSPFEVSSKADVYMTYRGYETFFMED